MLVANCSALRIVKGEGGGGRGGTRIVLRDIKTNQNPSAGIDFDLGDEQNETVRLWGIIFAHLLPLPSVSFLLILIMHFGELKSFSLDFFLFRAISETR